MAQSREIFLKCNQLRMSLGYRLSGKEWGEMSHRRQNTNWDVTWHLFAQLCEDLEAWMLFVFCIVSFAFPFLEKPQVPALRTL